MSERSPLGIQIVLTVLLVLSTSTVGMADTPPTACDDSPPSAITASPHVPCDFPNPGSLAADDLARFAWNTFIGLSWPAEDPYTSPYVRGVADTSASYGTTTPTVVWDSWREKRELYQIRDVSGTYKYVAPPTWNDGRPPSTTGPNPQIGQCSLDSAEAHGLPSGHVTALQTNKVENYLDETDEIGLAVLWSNNTDLPTEDSLVRYQVKMSHDYYAQVQGNGWWNPSTLNAAIQASPNGFSVILPSGSNSSGATGTILIKTGWKQLTSADHPSDFYTVTALYYLDEDGEPCYTYQQFGLIAIHIIRKTETFPYFFYSTFEHSDNTPGKFLYANTNRGSKGGEGTGYASTLANPFGITYDDPPAPQPNTTSAASPAYPALRLIQPSAAVQQANSEAAAVNRGTVWANYRLVGYQYMPVAHCTGNNVPVGCADPWGSGYYGQGSPAPGGTGRYPRYYADQDFYLANPVVETNQRFQFFEGKSNQTDVANLNLYKNNDPTQPLAGTVNMGGCMGCHGVAQQRGTDFSFTLGAATDEPNRYSAETLAEKCRNIGLALNPENGACVQILAIDANQKITTRATLSSPYVAAPDEGGLITGLAVIKTKKQAKNLGLAKGSYLAIGTNGKLYTRASLDEPYVAAPDVGGVVTCIALVEDGTILGIGTTGKLYTRANLSSSYVAAPDVGGVVTGISILLDGTILAIGTNGKLYTRADLSSSYVEAPDVGGVVTAVAVRNDGSILAIGTNGKLYTRANLSSSYVKAPDVGGVVTGLAIP